MQVTDLSAKPFVARELMLIKVRCNAAQRRELSDLADIFHGTVCDVSLTTITLELQGKEDKMHALQGLLEPYGENLLHPLQRCRQLPTSEQGITRHKALEARCGAKFAVYACLYGQQWCL